MKKNFLKITILVIIDQFIKFIITNTIAKTGENIIILPNILNLNYVENTGGAFGVFLTRIFLIGVDLLIIFVILKIILTQSNELDEKTNLGLLLIFAGGTSNLIDRIFRGYVIDYIDFTKIINYPVFNLADVYICIGIILLMIIIIKDTIKKQENADEGV